MISLNKGTWWCRHHSALSIEYDFFKETRVSHNVMQFCVREVAWTKSSPPCLCGYTDVRDTV
jgi:hypothetical protein